MAHTDRSPEHINIIHVVMSEICLHLNMLCIYKTIYKYRIIRLELPENSTFETRNFYNNQQAHASRILLSMVYFPFYILRILQDLINMKQTMFYKCIKLYLLNKVVFHCLF